MFCIFVLYKNKVSPECTKIVFTKDSGLQQHVRPAFAARRENLVLMQGKKAKLWPGFEGGGDMETCTPRALSNSQHIRSK
jgi:hypothetical protein